MGVASLIISHHVLSNPANKNQYEPPIYSQRNPPMKEVLEQTSVCSLTAEGKPNQTEIPARVRDELNRLRQRCCEVKVWETQ